MAQKSASTAITVGYELVLTRIFDAPRDVVFEAWTDPEAVAAWWGPADFTNTVHEWDVRPGGAINLDMHGPAGTPYDAVFPMKGVFEEIVRPARLVFTEGAFFDEQGVPGIQARTTVTFDEQSGKTLVTLRSVLLKAAPEYADALAGMEEGWKQQLDKLAGYLARR